MYQKSNLSVTLGYLCAKKGEIMANKGRNWSFTINQNDDPVMDPKTINGLFSETGEVKYLVFQLEKGELTGYRHYQGFISYRNAISFNTMRNVIASIHVEPVRGNLTHAIEYAKKPLTRINGPFEFGKEPSQGERSDLFDINLMIEDGSSTQEIRAKHPVQFLLYQNNIKNTINEIKRSKFMGIRKVLAFYLHGKTGVGKTRFIFDSFEHSSVYRVTDYTNPFDEYNFEPILVLDEYRGDFSISYMLNLLDIYPMQLKARYNNKTACFSLVFILSNISLDTVYSKIKHSEPESYKALLRRLKISGEFTRNKAKVLEILIEGQNPYIKHTLLRKVADSNDNK